MTALMSSVQKENLAEITLVDPVDYEFCLKNKKMSQKELFQWLDLNGDLDASILFIDRYIRNNCFGIIDVSEPIAEFDRWANSYDFSFDLKKPSERRQFIRFIQDYRKEKIYDKE